MPWRRIAAATILVLMLGSCTRSYLVTASFEGGALLFKTENDKRTFHPWCWNNFTVINEDARAVWEFEVPYGAFSGREPCGPNFPIRYGQPPERAETLIPAERLQVGRLYVIEGQASGMLEGAFKIERVDGGYKIRNVNPTNDAAVLTRDAYYDWERDHSPPRISETEPLNARFVVQSRPETIPKNVAAGAPGRDEFTWTLHPDEWWNLPALGYQDLTGERGAIEFWCRYTNGPIYARLPPPATKGSTLEMTSGRERMSVPLVGAGNPGRADRVDAVLPGGGPLFKSFSRTGKLAFQIGGRRVEADAITAAERAMVKRFFELCARSSLIPSPVVEARDAVAIH
jgi:hypothetical protein